MGRVFSVKQIINRQVPDNKTFEDAEYVFLNAVSEAIDRGEVSGGFSYGSVAVKSANIRSDFDGLISLTSPTSRPIGRKITQEVIRETGGLIPIDPIVKPRTELLMGRHSIDRFFGLHLQHGYRKVVGEDPSTYMIYRQQSAHDILASYIEQKVRRLEKTYNETNPPDVSDGGLQRMLELPAAIGRKTLQALVDTGIEETEVENSANKSELIAKTSQIFNTLGIEVGLNSLIGMNNDYNDMLDDALNGAQSISAYMNGISYMHSRLPFAVDWLCAVESTVLPLLKDTQPISS